MMRPPRVIVALLLIASLLVGLGHIALLPPFDGFDETAHYSYIQQIAETGRWPRRSDKLSQDIPNYLEVAPTTENMHGRWTYLEFFASNAATIAAGRQAIQSPPATPRTWAPAVEANWQAQHPPLYYALLAPAYLASKTWSLATQLFVLRALSYLIAWAGLCIVALWAMNKGADTRMSMLPLAIGLWPAIFPMWFPEMGRLGNDSLITAFAALTLVLVHRIALAAGTVRDYALLGLALGLALLTKATFLPVVAATILFLAIRIGVAWRRSERFAVRMKGTWICVGIVLAVSGWWYAVKLLETGSAIGSNDVVNMHSSGGLIAGLAKNLTIPIAIKAPWDLVTSFLWSGTWSFVQPPRIAMVPLVLLLAALAYGIYRYVSQQGARSIDWFMALVLGLFLTAIGYHSLVLLSLAGVPAPTWYLHSLAPILALGLSQGLAGLGGATWMRHLMTALLAYALAFLPAVTAMSLLFFAGCAPLLPRRNLAGSSVAECLADYPRMYEHLAILALPGIGLVLFVAGWVAMVVAALIALQAIHAHAAAASRGTIPAAG